MIRNNHRKKYRPHKMFECYLKRSVKEKFFTEFFFNAFIFAITKTGRKVSHKFVCVCVGKVFLYHFFLNKVHFYAYFFFVFLVLSIIGKKHPFSRLVYIL